jgi:hypothetical protein
MFARHSDFAAFARASSAFASSTASRWVTIWPTFRAKTGSVRRDSIRAGGPTRKRAILV